MVRDTTRVRSLVSLVCTWRTRQHAGARCLNSGHSSTTSTRDGAWLGEGLIYVGRWELTGAHGVPRCAFCARAADIIVYTSPASRSSSASGTTERPRPYRASR